jgi:hypothetical protein
VPHPTRGKQWEKPIQEECSIIKNKTWSLFTWAKNRKDIAQCKWVFKHKKDELGKINRLKVYLVASGFRSLRVGLLGNIRSGR